MFDSYYHVGYSFVQRRSFSAYLDCSPNQARYLLFTWRSRRRPLWPIPRLGGKNILGRDWLKKPSLKSERMFIVISHLGCPLTTGCSRYYWFEDYLVSRIMQHWTNTERCNIPEDISLQLLRFPQRRMDVWLGPSNPLRTSSNDKANKEWIHPKFIQWDRHEGLLLG